MNLGNLYKKRYMIAVYTYDNDFVDIFDNVREMALAFGIDVNYEKEYKSFRTRLTNCTRKVCPLATRYIYYSKLDVMVRPYLIDCKEDVDQEVLL